LAPRPHLVESVPLPAAPVYDIARSRRLERALVLGWWAIFGLFLTGQYVLTLSFAEALFRGLVAASAGAVITLAAFALARRYPLDRAPRLRSIAIHVAAGLVIAVFELTVRYFAGRLLGLYEEQPLVSVVVPAVPTNLISYWLLVGIGHGLEFYRRYRLRESQAAQLGSRLAQAELHLLKSQLQPHFLFNTLHAISALMHRDVKAADRMIARLSELLRAALDNAAAQEVTLYDELAFLDAYLAIERIRLGERLTVDMQIDPDSLDALVPHMLLQPIVENAIRHGIAPRSAPGSLRITATRPGSDLSIEIIDDGRGYSAPSMSTTPGLGLANTTARLEHLYGDDFDFDIDDAPGGGCRVALRIPFHTAGATAGNLITSSAANGRRA
jgi:two-component system, LytTR family, sensor kinase